jgi:hypothetical protein
MTPSIVLALLASGAVRAQFPPPAPPPAQPVQQPPVFVEPTAFDSAALSGARRLLAGSETGKPIIEALGALKVRVTFGTMSRRQHGGYGHDSSGAPVIMLERVGSGETASPRVAALNLAVILAHEATHARQYDEWKLAASAENEAECFFKELDAYHELKQKGEPNGTLALEIRYRLLRGPDGVNALVKLVLDAYDTELSRLAMREPDYDKALAAWRASGESDRFRPLSRLLAEARTDQRRAELRRASEHWNRVLSDFRRTVASWPPEK